MSIRHLFNLPSSMTAFFAGQLETQLQSVSNYGSGTARITVQGRLDAWFEMLPNRDSAARVFVIDKTAVRFYDALIVDQSFIIRRKQSWPFNGGLS